MQEIENEQKQPPVAPAESTSQPFPPVSLTKNEENEDDPEQIFLRAVAEIDTQPLQKKVAAVTIADVLEIIFLVSLLGVGFFGLVWQCITYPHTLVIVYAKEQTALLTATLAVPSRALAPVTLTRSQTAPTTGHGYQDARSATGTLIFYNGSANPQSIPGGTVFLGKDGVKVTTEQSITVPAANLPGSQGNIAAFDITIALSSDLKVRNETPFSNGRDARTYRAVAPQDIQTLTSTLNDAVTQAFLTAFPLRQGEEAIPTTCHTTTSANHHIGDEAQSMTLTASKTCSAVAYHQDELTREATTAFIQTKPATNYHIVGSVQTTIQSVSPLTVTISGKWVYTFSPAYEQLLAQRIAGDTPAQAQKVLLRTEVISYANIPTTLPPEAMYINFLVLVG